MAKGPRLAGVAVLGAGIVGASVAYHGARAGAEVVLLEKSLPASGVTGDSFAWIGGPGGRDAVDGSTPLRRTALDGYRRLERELPDVQVRWSGSLTWGEEALSDIDALGPDERLVSDLEHPADRSASGISVRRRQWPYDRLDRPRR